MRLTGVATVLLAAILCGSCGGSAEPVNAADLRGPGTDLPDGLSVQPGSQLIGPVVPAVPGAGAGASGWRAVVLVDGDPVDIWDSYLDHVRTALDLELPAAPAGAGCQGDGEKLDCSWFVQFAESDGYVSLQLEAPVGDVTGRWQIELDTDGVAERRSGRVEDPSPLDVDVEPPARNPPAGDRPEPGDPLSPATMYQGERFTLRAGSELVTQYGHGGATGGLQVLLAVTGNPAEIALEYRQQCGTLFSPEYAEEETFPAIEFDGFTVTEYRYDVGAGAGTCAVALFEGGERTYLTVERFAD